MPNGITRIDQPRRGNHGWTVSRQSRGVKISQYFADKKHGGREAARALAVDFELQARAQLDQLPDRKIRTAADKRAYTRDWHRQHLKGLRETGMPCKYTIKRKYGLSLEQYARMLSSQNGVCKICGKPETQKQNKRLSIDHDHKTGRVRGLLCFNCNTGLGRFLDSTCLLSKALEYITPTPYGPR